MRDSVFENHLSFKIILSYDIDKKRPIILTWKPLWNTADTNQYGIGELRSNLLHRSDQKPYPLPQTEVPHVKNDPLAFQLAKVDRKFLMRHLSENAGVNSIENDPDFFPLDSIL